MSMTEPPAGAKLAAALSRLRKQSGMDQKQMAEALAATRPTDRTQVSRYETGDRRPPDALLEAWLTACGATPAEREEVRALADREGREAAGRERCRTAAVTQVRRLAAGAGGPAEIVGTLAASYADDLRADARRFDGDPSCLPGGQPDEGMGRLLRSACAANAAGRQELAYWALDWMWNGIWNDPYLHVRPRRGYACLAGAVAVALGMVARAQLDFARSAAVFRAAESLALAEDLPLLRAEALQGLMLTALAYAPLRPQAAILYGDRLAALRVELGTGGPEDGNSLNGDRVRTLSEPALFCPAAPLAPRLDAALSSHDGTRREAKDPARRAADCLIRAVGLVVRGTAADAEEAADLLEEAQGLLPAGEPVPQAKCLAAQALLAARTARTRDGFAQAWGLLGTARRTAAANGLKSLSQELAGPETFVAGLAAAAGFRA